MAITMTVFITLDGVVHKSRKEAINHAENKAGEYYRKIHASLFDQKYGAAMEWFETSEATKFMREALAWHDEVIEIQRLEE
jgi:hypothetical protein